METLLTTLLTGGFEQLFAWLATSGGLAVVLVLGIEALKRTNRVPWLNQYTDEINRGVSVVLAIFAANGISYAYDGATAQLVITGLAPANLAKVCAAIIMQFGLQELAYHALVKRVLRR